VPKYESVNGEKGSDEMLAPIWRPAGRRTNVAIVSTERQFDSHYLEEHLDLDLKEQRRKVVPTHRVRFGSKQLSKAPR